MRKEYAFVKSYINIFYLGVRSSSSFEGFINLNTSSGKAHFQNLRATGKKSFVSIGGL